MKKTLLLPVVALFAVQYSFSQTAPIEKETWADKPVIHTIDAKYSAEPAVIIADTRRVEYTDESKEMMNEYYTLHKIIHINDDRGIEDFNKIYLGLNDNSDIVDVKARTILPGGKIIELDKDNIKETKDKDENVYKIFAMDGLEKGCEVEYFYTFKRPVSYFGREVLQGRFPVLKTSFQIVGPARLKFETKTYNLSLTATDTTLNGKRITECDFKGLAGAEEEKYTYYDANLARVEFKLSYNESSSQGERLFTWNELAKRIYGIYSFTTDKENKVISDLVRQNAWDQIVGEPAKIIAVENYIKTKIGYNEDLSSEDANEIGKIIKNKAAGTIGIVRLYNGIFTNIGINFQFVLTSNRERFFIDRQFENWNNCDNPIFYFPAEGKYMAPTKPDYRYPWILPSWGDANGLYCKHTSLGTFSTAIAEVKNIPLEDYTKSVENLEAKLELTAGLDSLTIDDKQIFSGYAAITFRDAFNFANAEQQRDIIKELTKSYASSENILSSEVLNKEFENENTNVPLVLHTVTKSGELIERAGNKLLLKIGLAIGPQVEMYQEKPRQQPINLDYGHVEERKIDFIIPDGYTISNPNDLKISQTYMDNGQLTMGFVSDYEIKGNVLSIHIKEQYNTVSYPFAQFDQFRKIINASSDFNKVVLVLQRKV